MPRVEVRPVVPTKGTWYEEALLWRVQQEAVKVALLTLPAL